LGACALTALGEEADDQDMSGTTGHVYLTADGPMPIAQATTYAHRDVLLYPLNLAGFAQLLVLRKVTPADSAWAVEAAAMRDNRAALDALELSRPVGRHLHGRPVWRYMLRAPHPLATSHVKLNSVTAGQTGTVTQTVRSFGSHFCFRLFSLSSDST
jgi:hypothetical protein